jgi:hypothetical protein
MTDKIPDKIKVPHFDNESDEAAWWYDNREEHGKIMAKAMKEGRTTTLKQVLEERGIDASELAIPADRSRRQRASAGG